MNKKKAIVPGTFDPITKGHFDLIETASLLFDEVTVLLGTNGAKSTRFSDEERLGMVKQAIAGLPNVRAELYGGLVGEYCASHGIGAIVKGLRFSKDFEYEHEMAEVNAMLSPQTKTIFLHATRENAFVSSTMVRTFLDSGRSVDEYLPQGVTLPRGEQTDTKED
ncbi:MAG: pantetheine-phosphate adenylyltransferase [Ruminococcaceae bacterium]|nr:pantetheine-phosphate adenylyltransferase [Oscillospiraceae bacterium]